MLSIKTWFYFVFIAAVQQTWAYNSYMVVCPQAIRPGGEFSCKVTLLDTFRRLKIMVQVKSEAASFEVSQNFTIRRVDSMKLITMDLPSSMPVQIDYKVFITAFSRMERVEFKNNASLIFKEKSMSTLIQTDKAIYKPGQLVQFRCFAVNSKLQVINGTKDIDIFDPLGNKIAQWLDVDGSYSVYKGKLQLADEPPLGDWTLECTVNEGETKKQVFTVEEYVLPKFEVSIHLPDFGVMTDKYLAGTVTAKYTFNKGVEGTGKLTIRKKFRGFGEKSNEYVEEFDINGEYSFQIDRKELFEKLGIKYPTTLEVEAEVTESLTDKTLSNMEEIQYFNREEKLVFLEGADNFKPGLKYTGYVFLSDQNDQPLGQSGLVINITVTFYSFDEDINGTTIGPTSIPLPKNGIAAFTFRVLLNVTRVDVLAQYDKDLKVTKVLQQFQSSSKTYVQVSLLTKSAKAGRNATFRITSTTRKKYLTYMIISRGNIVVCDQVYMENRWLFLRLMMTAEMAPSARIVVYFVKRNAEIIVDSISFNVEGIFANDVTVGWSMRSSQPGKPVSLIVRADPGSQCSVLAVDKSVLLLKTGNDITQEMIEDEIAMYDSVTPSPCSPFRPCLRLFFPMPNRGTDAASVFRDAGLVVMTDAYLHEVTPPWRGPFPPFMLEDAMVAVPFAKGGVRAESRSGPRVRQIFPETWLFSDEIADASGKCIINATTPDTITTWVATAFAISYSTGLGVAPQAANLRSFLNFFIRLELPYSVIRYEQVILQVTVFNFYTRTLRARVTLERSDHFQNILVVRNERNQTELQFRKRTITRTVIIPAESGVSINFPIRPVDVGNIDIMVTAISSLARDAVKRQLLVEPEGIPESYNIPILVQIRPWQVFNVTEEITYPEKVVPDSKRIRVSAIGDLMGPSINGLTNLLQMPYGCGEQNMITFTPNVYVINYLDAINNLKPDDLSKGQSFMLNGYQRQLTYQHIDGSFSAFGNRDPSGSTWLTAFVVKSFAEAKPYIFIDQSVMRRAINWLLERYNTQLDLFDEPGRVIHTEMQGGSASGERSLTAYTLIALLEAVENGFTASNQTLLLNIINKATSALEDSVGNLTVYEMCIISYALALTESDKLDTLLEDLDDEATYEGGMKYWEVTQEPDDSALRWKPPNVQAKTRNIEATSYVLLTYATINNVTSGLQVIKWLVKQRNPNGGFGSTQDTIIALQALSEFAALVYNPYFNLTINILCEPSSFGYIFMINETNALLFQSVYVPVNTTSITVTATGNGTALVEIAVRYNVEEEPIIPLFSLSVSFTDETLNGFKLRICFRWLGKDKSSMAVMEINLLSGFGADRFSVTDLSTLKRVEEKVNQLVLYFDEITTRTVCISVKMERQGLVTGTQPAEISLYDYYEPHKRVSTLYQPKILKRADICDIGGCEVERRAQAPSGRAEDMS